MYNSYSDYRYSSYGSGYSTSNFAVGFIITFFIVILIFAGLYSLMSWLLMRIFKKAGLPAWKAWVPVVQIWTFFELGGYNGALSLLYFASFIPVVGWITSIVQLVFFCMAAKEISKKLQKPDSFILFPLGLISFGITTIVWYFQMALTENKWNDALGKESLAKGTILGYQVVEEQPAATPAPQPAEVVAPTPITETAEVIEKTEGEIVEQ